MKHRLLMAVLMLFTCNAQASDGIFIPQVSSQKNAAESSDPELLNNDINGSDYQEEILSNPALNDRARASAIINQKTKSGNIAIINQQGGNNRSAVIQKGKNNIAKQTQKGHINDVYVEQQGDENHSEEEQIGNYRHKIIIQNGERYEEVQTIKDSNP